MTVTVDPRSMPANWRLAKRYPVVQDGRVRMVPYELARRVVRFTGVCVGEHTDGPVAAEQGSWLCWRCAEDMRRSLLGIETRWPTLQEMLYPGQGGGSEVRSKSVDPAAPVALDVVPITAQVDLAVRGLVSQLIEDRPDLRLVGGHNTGAVAGMLGRWYMGWMTGHPSRSLLEAALPEVLEAYYAMPVPAKVAEARGRCPSPRCPGMLRSRTSDLLACDFDRSHVYPTSRWVEIAKARRRG